VRSTRRCGSQTEKLLRTDQVKANLVTLKEDFRLPSIANLMARKLASTENSTLSDADITLH
jgi:hypothetical protein